MTPRRSLATSARVGGGRTAACGCLRRDCRRYKLARDNPRAAQAAAISPLPGATATTASIKAPRRLRSEDPARPPLFLDFDNRLGALQPLLQTAIVAQGLRQFRRQWIGFSDFGAALGRAQRFEGAGVALTPPVRQGRRVKPLAAHDRAEPSRDARRPLNFPEDAQLVLPRERAATGTVQKFRRRSRRR